MPRLRRPALVALIAIPLVAGGFVVQERASANGERLFGQVLSVINERYVDSVEVGALYEKAARGLVSELKDPYAELYSPKQLEAFNTTTGGVYAGVGMLIEHQEPWTVISKVYPNTPAAEAGIQAGDKIVGVDTFSTRGWNNEQVSNKLKGPAGTKVKAKFSRAGVPEPFEATFIRRVVRIPAVPYALMLENKTGYIPVTGFNETAAGEVAQAVQKLSAEGARAYVLDLRGNPGGYLEQALMMSNIFLPKGKQIVSVKGRGQPDEVHVTESAPLVPNLPVVILQDGYSASASEIVAGALQDHDRAIVVGTTSFGKGLVQGMFRLDGGYAIKLTTAKWYTPSGRSIQKERKLTDDGRLVEVAPDSLESDSARKARPKFKSDGGRVVYGGGAITPDIVVYYDTLSTLEQKVARALAAKQQESYLALYDVSFAQKGKVTPDFTITPALRDQFYDALVKKGVVIDRKDFDAGVEYIDRSLDGRISSLAFGDSTAKRRDVKEDRQLTKALELLKKGSTTKELLAVAASTPGDLRADKPKK